MHCKSKTHYIPSPCIESQCQKGGKPKHIVFISALNLTDLSNVKKESKFLEIPWNTSLSKNRRLCRAEPEVVTRYYHTCSFIYIYKHDVILNYIQDLDRLVNSGLSRAKKNFNFFRDWGSSTSAIHLMVNQTNWEETFFLCFWSTDETTTHLFFLIENKSQTEGSVDQKQWEKFSS